MNNINTNVNYSCWKTIILTFAAAALLLVFSGCFSPWEGDGTLTIDLGGGDLSRAAINSNEIANFDYEIILEGPGGKITKTVKGGGAITLELAPGTWDLMLRAIGDRPDDDPLGDYKLSEYFPPRMLRALGFDNAVDVKAGKNTRVTLKMTAAMEVENKEQLYQATQMFYSFDKPGIFIIKKGFSYDGNFYLEGQDLTLITDNTDKEVELIFTDKSTRIFVLYSNTSLVKPSALTLGRPGMKGSLVLNGNGEDSPRLGSIVSVGNDCTLIVYDGVKLRNNLNNDPSGNPGGGVFVDSGTFIMHGGEVSGNVVQNNGNNGGYGGGVYVEGTLEMHGNSRISGNKVMAGTGYGATGGNGGGIHVASGIFIMSGGEISGNTADGSNNSSPSSGRGGGVYISEGEYFEKTGGVIYGNNGEDSSNYATQAGEAVYSYSMFFENKYRDDDVWDNISYIRGDFGGKWNE